MVKLITMSSGTCICVLCVRAEIGNKKELLIFHTFKISKMEIRIAKVLQWQIRDGLEELHVYLGCVWLGKYYAYTNTKTIRRNLVDIETAQTTYAL